MNIRTISSKDLEAIRVSLEKAILSAEDKGWLHTVDIQVALGKIQSDFISLIIEDTYLLCADVVTPWYSGEETKVLAEMLVLRVYDGPGKFSSIPRALHSLAGVVGAGSIVVGTALATSNRALARMYLREGFIQSGVELSKKL